MKIKLTDDELDKFLVICEEARCNSNYTEYDEFTKKIFEKYNVEYGLNPYITIARILF